VQAGKQCWRRTDSVGLTPTMLSQAANGDVQAAALSFCGSSTVKDGCAWEVGGD